MDTHEKYALLEALKKRLPPDSRLEVCFYIETDMKQRAYKAARALAEQVGGRIVVGRYDDSVLTVEKDGEHVANICWTVPQEVSVSRED